jgi:hypothetical protein
MARIRSVHPGLFTDEAFVSVSIPARLLLIALWTECDDVGTFVWDAERLKRTLYPADDVDVVSLLQELQGQGVVLQYTVDGVDYGAVGNFWRMQNTRLAAFVGERLYPTTDVVDSFLGLSGRPPDGAVDPSAWSLIASQTTAELRPPQSVWQRLRRFVFSRDGHRCQYCGTTDGPMTCDHVLPLARGGSNDISNLTTACAPCNRSKGSNTVSEWVRA